MHRDTSSCTVHLDWARPVEAVTTMTRPAEARGAVLEAHVPGEGWRGLGSLSAAGWTQTPTKGLRADALRVAVPSARPVLVSPSAPEVTGAPRRGLHGGARARPVVR